jgi:FkbM family methyltransferase
MARVARIGSPAWVRRKLALGYRYRVLRDTFKLFGALGTLRYGYQVLLGHRFGAAPEYQLEPALSSHPLTLRRRTSDLLVFRQVFIDREYGCLDGLEGVGLIVDAGANVGLTSAYMLSRWPAADLVALEPHEGNHQLATRNLAAFGDRARVLKGALWSHPCSLRIREEADRSGREWSVQVREAEPGEVGDVVATDVPSLLRASGHNRISILKMDIEGAEAVVFSGPCPWLDQVDTLVVELHEDRGFGDAFAAFRRAIDGRGFISERSGELTVCRRHAGGASLAS